MCWGVPNPRRNVSIPAGHAVSFPVCVHSSQDNSMVTTPKYQAPEIKISKSLGRDYIAGVDWGLNLVLGDAGR